MAAAYYDLLRNRSAVRAQMDDLLARLDLESVHRQALHWVPGGDHEIPAIRLIYDSNAGSFTAEGQPFFNLYSERGLAELCEGEPEARFASHAAGIMAHELQHVLARPVLYPRRWSRPGSWQRRWVDRVVRGLVSESTAAHCNPPSGIRQWIWEDPQVLTSLVSRLNDMLRAIRDGRTGESDVEHWYQDNFQRAAEDLLRRFLAREASGSELDAQVRRYAPLRPDLEHVLGWWMVSCVSARGERREDVLTLLRAPETLFARYNAASAGAGAQFLVAEDVVAYVATLIR